MTDESQTLRSVKLEYLVQTGEKLVDDGNFLNVQTRVYRAGLHMIEILDE